MSGMRPTGRLHLGHYLGVLKNWVALQEQHPCFYMVADFHALTTRWQDTEAMASYVHDMVLDWLAVGLDPEQCTIYVQSAVPEDAELHLLLSMLTPVKWCETDPTLKDMVTMARGATAEGDDDEDAGYTYGLLGYPVLQTADILKVRGALVPVGKDQAAHLEISRDIARRFNHTYGAEVFPEPRPLFTEVPRLVGLDGRKMGKSYNNAIFLSDSADDTWQKLRTAITDPARVKREDPGNPEACVAVFPYYKLFASEPVIQQAAEECRMAKRGCVDCKKILAEVMNETLAPIRARRAALATDPGTVARILAEGNARTREAAADTLRAAKAAMGMWVGV